jgi:probable O-glycosylation ligase (exosortase A-associated)
MLRSLWISGAYGAFLCAGFMAPFALGLGYVWVDNFVPQRIVYSILTEIPVSQVMAVGAIGAYLLADRRHPPQINTIMVMMVLMLMWCTYTTFDDPVAPVEAQFKWSWAGKTIVFALFMPALFRSRVQIESFLQIYVLSLSAQYLPFAAKTLISGGAYGASFGLVSGNDGLAEGSTLATVCMVAAVICLHLSRYQIILPAWRITRWGYLGLAFACIVAGIGTYERDALVGIAVVTGALWLRSRRKVMWAVIAGAAIISLGGYMLQSDSAWLQRMMTIGDSHEGSSYGRILVWQWTLDFVREHPFGGGFYAYVVDMITFPGTVSDPTPVIVHGKAFHSIYFELLGEQGWPGLGLFFALVGATLLTLRQVTRMCRVIEGMEWASDLAITLMIALAVLLVCGAFISIAFQPEMYYTFSMAVMLRQHVRGVRRRILEETLKHAEREDRRRAELGDDVAGPAWGGALA